MAQYEVKLAQLGEIGDSFISLSKDLSALRERLDSAIAFVRNNGYPVRTQNQGFDEICAKAAKMGALVHEIVEVYASAERLEFGGTAGASMKPASSANTVTNINSGGGVVFSESLPLSDWLKAAVINYEQNSNA